LGCIHPAAALHKEREKHYNSEQEAEIPDTAVEAIALHCRVEQKQEEEFEERIADCHTFEMVGVEHRIALEQQFAANVASASMSLVEQSAAKKHNYHGHGNLILLSHYIYHSKRSMGNNDIGNRPK